MHSAIVAACFLLIVLVPCLVAMQSASKEGRSGNTDEHVIAPPAAAFVERRKGDRRAGPSRIRMAAEAALGKDAPVANTVGQQPSRVRNVAAALVHRAPAHSPMAAGDPGSRKQSIRELRAKHAAAKSARS
jgi:hypothetical protein